MIFLLLYVLQKGKNIIDLKRMSRYYSVRRPNLLKFGITWSPLTSRYSSV